MRSSERAYEMELGLELLDDVVGDVVVRMHAIDEVVTNVEVEVVVKPPVHGVPATQPRAQLTQRGQPRMGTKS
jgi:hypothetical protein